MRIAVGSDERAIVADSVIEFLRFKMLDVELHGALKHGDTTQWADLARRVGERVSSGACNHGVLFCWTGTGVSIAANKVIGVRAALCCDPETARGSRLYNDANVLCLSIRLTSPQMAREIIEAWLTTTETDKHEKASIDLVNTMDRQRHVC